MSDPPLTIGTAGHVDHGKTALVRALTGRDTDRLPAEHERGISINLGFAELELSGERRISLVDVPGHERFVKTMVAGASGIDMHLMCVAADDGVMPQTREHAAVLRQLRIDAGVAAITKVDAREPASAGRELAELLPGIPVVATSVRTGEGLDELRDAIDAAARGLPGRREATGPTRLHVDRAFTLHGIGTVVTGTLWAGSLGAGDAVQVLPSGRRARVRSIQVHERPAERARAGQRVAAALTGVHHTEVARGDVVCLAETELASAYRIDAALELEEDCEPLAPGARVQVHHGTRQSAARVVPLDERPPAPGGCSYVQLRLESPLIPARGDRLVLRSVASPAVIGGAGVIDAGPRRHGRSAAIVERLRALERGESPPAEEASAPPAKRAADPRPAVPDRLSAEIGALLEADGPRPRSDAALAEALGLTTAELGAGLDRLVEEGLAVRVGPAQHFSSAALTHLSERALELCRRDGRVTIASVRDELGTSRKYAQALLEHLDRERLTLRVGDERILRRRR